MGTNMSHKILIIDDDRDVYDTLAIRLESFGYQMAWAKNGTEGYAQAKAQKPDLIFLDFNMENESGLDVLRTLKKDPSEEIKKIPRSEERRVGKEGRSRW